MIKKICIFIGPPGAGKGTLSALCVKELGFRQFSTGNLCRQHIDEQTPVGKKIDFAIKSGKLVSDSLIIEMVDQWMVDNELNTHAIIFDGFPRTPAQARAIHDLLRDKYDAVQLNVVQLQVSEQELIRRVLARLICKNKECQAVYSDCDGSSADERCDECDSPLSRRPDDTYEAMSNRLSRYFEHEKEILNFYDSLGVEPYKLQADRSLEVVFAELKNVLT